MESKGTFLLAAAIIMATAIALGCLSDQKEADKETNVSAPSVIVPTQVPELETELAPEKQDVPILWEIGSCGYESKLDVKLTNLKDNKVKVRIKTGGGIFEKELLPKEIRSVLVPFGTQSGTIKSNVEIFADDVPVYKKEIEKYCGTGGSSGGSGENTKSAQDPIPSQTPALVQTPSATPTVGPLPTQDIPSGEYC